MGTTKNKTRQFEIPKGFVGTFFTQLEESNLEYELIEVDQENDEIVIEVEYSNSERDEVMNLIELLDEYLAETEEEEEEEDN